MIRRRAVHAFQTFRAWLTRASDKTDKLDVKTQREAAELVRRTYNRNGHPNEALRDLYSRGKALKVSGEAARAAADRSVAP